MTTKRQEAGAKPLRDVPVEREALEEAFNDNSPSAHSYLHLATGCVIRVVDGVDDPALLGRLALDGDYARIDGVSSAEQFRWMARFVATVGDAERKAQLFEAIGGKGAFRRFKDLVMANPDERARWFAFRSERVRAVMEEWLRERALRAVPPETWPSSHDEGSGEALRRNLDRIAGSLDADELEKLTALAAFLMARRPARPAVVSCSAP